MAIPETFRHTAKTIRLIHAALIGGVIVFAVVGHVVMRPAMSLPGGMPILQQYLMLGIAVGALAVGLVLQGRIPAKSTDQSADLFWMTAATPAIVAWAPFEGAALCAIVLYALGGPPMALGVAALSVVIFGLLNPAHLEKR